MYQTLTAFHGSVYLRKVYTNIQLECVDLKELNGVHTHVNSQKGFCSMNIVASYNA